MPRQVHVRNRRAAAAQIFQNVGKGFEVDGCGDRYVHQGEIRTASVPVCRDQPEIAAIGAIDRLEQQTELHTDAGALCRTKQQTVSRCSPDCWHQAPTTCFACRSSRSGNLRFMTQLLRASMALVPLFDQRVPRFFSRSPNCLQSRFPTKPDPTWMPWSR